MGRNHKGSIVMDHLGEFILVAVLLLVLLMILAYEQGGFKTIVSGWRLMP